MVKTTLGYVYNQNALGIRIILDDAAHLLGGIKTFGQICFGWKRPQVELPVVFFLESQIVLVFGIKMFQSTLTYIITLILDQKNAKFCLKKHNKQTKKFSKFQTECKT